MTDFIKKNILLIVIFLITLSSGFLTFLTFIDKSFLQLNENNIQILLILNSLLFVIFFVVITIQIKNSLKNDIDRKGSTVNRRYIVFFFDVYINTIDNDCNIFIVFIFICTRKIFR